MIASTLLFIGSGKTYTMMGDFNSTTMQKIPGIYLLAAHDIFDYIQQVPDLLQLKCSTSL